MTIEEIKESLVKAGWFPETLEIAIEAGFKCQYCGLDFYASVNDYDSMEVEHIIPRDPGSDELSNKTLSCRTCNKLKRRWDPSRDQPAETDRRALISRATEHVKKLRAQKEVRVAKEKALVDQLLSAMKEGSE